MAGDHVEGRKHAQKAIDAMFSANKPLSAYEVGEKMGVQLGKRTYLGVATVRYLKKINAVSSAGKQGGLPVYRLRTEID